jgi:Magnesium chelatase, subunit ChlI
MLARRLTTILPAMTLAEALETTRLQCVAGLTGARAAVGTARPCRAPHHTISDVGVIGGGQVPRPGECRWLIAPASTSMSCPDRCPVSTTLTPCLSRLISACLTRELASYPCLNGKHIPLDTTVLPS